MANNKKNVSNSGFSELNSELILKSEPNEIEDYKIPEFSINTTIKKENPTQVVGCSIEFVSIQVIKNEVLFEDKSEDIGRDHLKVN